MSAVRSSDPTPLSLADDSEREALHRVYSLVRRLVAERIVVDAQIERRLAVIVLLTYCAEQRLSSGASHADEVAVAKRCVEGLMARTSLTCAAPPA